MENIEIKTLVDITNTRAVRLNQGTQLEVNQQRNFITLLQCAELRSVIEYSGPPVIETVDVKNLGFGTKYKGTQRVWTFKFNTDRSGVYSDQSGNPIGCLIDDIHEVPVIEKLTETINMLKAVFDCKDTATKNTVITITPNY
jgi:hypothetical protein